MAREDFYLKNLSFNDPSRLDAYLITPMGKDGNPVSFNFKPELGDMSFIFSEVEKVDYICEESLKDKDTASVSSGSEQNDKNETVQKSNKEVYSQDLLTYMTNKNSDEGGNKNG